MALMLLGLIHGVTQSLPRGADVSIVDGFDTWHWLAKHCSSMRDQNRVTAPILK